MVISYDPTPPTPVNWWWVLGGFIVGAVVSFLVVYWWHLKTVADERKIHWNELETRYVRKDKVEDYVRDLKPPSGTWLS